MNQSLAEVAPLAGPRPGALILALGFGQILSWGILTYAIAVLGTPMAAEFQVPRSLVFGAFSLALLTSGIVAPYLGRAIDRIGGRTILRLGAVVAALALMLMSVTHSLTWFFFAWVLVGVAMPMSLYDAAFATLSQHIGTLRRAITAVTLLGGLASTVFIPLCLYCLQHYGWRVTIFAFAIVQLLINGLLYTAFIPAHRARAPAGSVGPASPAFSPTGAPPMNQPVALLAVAFAGAAFVTSSIAAHIVNILQAKGLPLESAVWVAALIGPMQVAGRIIELVTERHLGITSAAIMAFATLIAAIVVLGLAGASVALACVFAAMYGIANGIITIARGAVPVQLFGRSHYGATLGRIAAPSFVARAAAPFLVSLGIAGGASFGPMEMTLLAAALAGLVMFLLAMRTASTVHREV